LFFRRSAAAWLARDRTRLGDGVPSRKTPPLTMDPGRRSAESMAPKSTTAPRSSPRDVLGPVDLSIRPCLHSISPCPPGTSYVRDPQSLKRRIPRQGCTSAMLCRWRAEKRQTLDPGWPCRSDPRSAAPGQGCRTAQTSPRARRLLVSLRFHLVSFAPGSAVSSNVQEGRAGADVAWLCKHGLRRRADQIRGLSTGGLGTAVSSDNKVDIPAEEMAAVTSTYCVCTRTPKQYLI
jgi:hypothetical protein